MSSVVGGKLPESQFSKDVDVVYVDLDDVDKAAESLLTARNKFNGKKILFFKEGKNFFAVAKKDKPCFFWEQFFNIFRREPKKVPYYANDEVGDMLAKHFGEHGRNMQAQMNTGWFKRAISVDSKAFVDVIAENLKDRARRLDFRIQEWPNNEQNLPASGVTPRDLLPNIRNVIEQINKGDCEVRLGQFKSELDEIDHMLSHPAPSAEEASPPAYNPAAASSTQSSTHTARQPERFTVTPTAPPLDSTDALDHESHQAPIDESHVKEQVDDVIAILKQMNPAERIPHDSFGTQPVFTCLKVVENLKSQLDSPVRNLNTLRYVKEQIEIVQSNLERPYSSQAVNSDWQGFPPPLIPK